MRAMKSYDKILFQNNTDTEEFVITILRDETLKDTNEGVNDPVNEVFDCVNLENEPVNLKNERVNEIFEGVKQQNEGVKSNFEGVKSNFEGVKSNFEGVKLNIEGVKDKLNQELGIIYDFIKKNPLVKTADIELFNNKSKATIERYLKILKDNGLIEYIGSDKTGGYKVV